METTLEKTTVELPADLAKRMNEATTVQERNAVLAEFAQRQGADDPVKKDAMLMTDKQFRSFLEVVGESSANHAKEAIAAIAADVERKYQLDGDEAKEMAERSYVKAEERQRNQRADFEITAKVLRGMFLAREGKPDAYRAALEEEHEYVKRVYRRESRAMSLGTDSTGGYLAPTLFSDMLYENIARASLVRRYATVIQMNGNEVIKFPTLTSVPAGGAVAEGAAGTPGQPVFSQKQLDTQKLMTLSKPVSLEMIEKANPAIVPLLLQFATTELMKAEDSLVFGTSGDGIRASSTNEVTTGSAAEGFSSITFDDMADLEGELDPQYTPDEDIQGSGIVSGQARFWIPHKLRHQLRKKKDGNSIYLDEARELRNQKKIFGYDAKRVLSMPDGSSLSTGDKVAIFGDLSYVWCGVEPGFRIKMLEEGSVDSTNLAETGQVAIRVIEFFDNVVIDNEAFSQLKLAA